MTFKKTLGKIHLWFGLASGIVIVIVSLTGCLYVFEEEIRNFTQHEYRFVAQSKANKVSLAVLAQTIQKEFPNKQIEQLRLFSDPTRSAIAKLVDTKTIGKDGLGKKEKEEHEPLKVAYALNPYTGALISNQDLEHDTMHYVEKIHKSLLLGEAGKWIIKANVLIFLAMLLTGLYLWFPSKKNQRKHAFKPKLKGKFQVINYSIHNVLGFYFLLPLLLISLTGIWWAVKPVQKITYAALGETMKEKKKPLSTYQAGAVFSPQQAFATVATAYPGWQEAHINFAKNAKECVRVNLKYPYQFYKKSNEFEFDQYSGKILYTELYANYSVADKIKHSNRDLHTGQNFGVLGKFAAFLASLFAASLPITGFAIWWGRRKKTIAIPRNRPQQIAVKTQPVFKPKFRQAEKV